QAATLPEATERAVDTVRTRLNTQVTEARHSAIVEAAARVSPAVVSVNVLRRQRQASRRSPFDFFMPRDYERLVEGVGSGFVISADGIVITNQHVTDGAEQIVVTTPDGTDYDAELVGEDPLTDIAVLKIQGDRLPTAALGRSTDLTIGEWVVAIGNPYAYLLGNSEPTVTAGVVSAVGRNILPSQNQPGLYVDMIQTDAAINPGNSGGPLVNVLGEVVGVNSSIFTDGGGSVGIGFAIPIERALRVAGELADHGTVRRAWVGIDVNGSENLRRWKDIGGLEVSEVASQGPAEEADIRPGDVLVRAKGRRLRTFLDWEAVKLDMSPGEEMPVTLRRGGRERTVNVRVSSLPTAEAERVSVLDIELISVNPAIRQERGLQRDFGALVYSIGDRARQATRLLPGDVILQINQRRIEDADDVSSIFERMAGQGWLRVFFERDGQVRSTDFRIR
ncbi:MAG: trypsin-like peptidase domain-containing protein, partial [Gemmatimonadota bacterium]|nr:trypsin-like peptidase domain-containing protein [Gemmatimonadota bacterium]